MSTKEQKDRSESPSEQAGKLKDYNTPILTRYGNISSVTMTGPNPGVEQGEQSGS